MLKLIIFTKKIMTKRTAEYSASCEIKTHKGKYGKLNDFKNSYTYNLSNVAANFRKVSKLWQQLKLMMSFKLQTEPLDCGSPQ